MPFGVALSGLNAAWNRLRSTANNVANVSTPGFKQSRAELVDMGSVPGGVRVSTVTAQTSQGTLQFTGNALDLAVSGNGYFALNDNGSTVYSRDGSFHLDRDGYMVNNQGQRLTAYGVDANGVSTGRLADVRVPPGNGAPVPTTQVELNANLDASATPPTAPFSSTDPDSFNLQASTTVYDSLGSEHQLDLYFRKTAVPGEWEVSASVDGASALSATSLQFSTNGSLAAPPSGSIAIPSFDPGNGAANMDINLMLDGVTQYGDASSINAVSQDGLSSSPLSGVTVSGSGTITAQYANGNRIHLGQIPTATFANPQGLQSLGNNGFAQTHASGEPMFGFGAVGSIQGGVLETSNVDLNEQLVSSLETRQLAQANIRVLQTADEMIGTLLDERA